MKTFKRSRLVIFRSVGLIGIAVALAGCDENYSPNFDAPLKAPSREPVEEKPILTIGDGSNPSGFTTGTSTTRTNVDVNVSDLNQEEPKPVDFFNADLTGTKVQVAVEEEPPGAQPANTYTIVIESIRNWF
ncbi:MAG: hypothetical protein GKR98_11200 [Boseongicola sp.]|nr:MAG: hypothetical protein GKR98_11200 [Boseongicola sp.]